jgi:hypothetical protein
MNHHRLKRSIFYSFVVLIVLIIGFIIWQCTKPVPTTGDWKDTLVHLSTADFHGDLVTVHDVRNFQYNASGTPTVENWYDKTYDLSKLVRAWYVVVPFNAGSPFAHTFMSFEFSDGSYLAITIEARLKKDQEYTMFNGLINNFPLMYIAADERDVVYVRTNIYKDDLYLYPLRATADQARLLLTDMLQRMNDLVSHPRWYNGFYANCTSSIADSVNKIWPGLLPRFDWQVLLTSYADQLALDKGLIDTNLPLPEARKKFYVTTIAQKIGYSTDFSEEIRAQMGTSTKSYAK